MSQFDILCKTPPKVLVRQFVERFERPSGEKIASCAAELTYLCWMITHNGTAIKRATFMSYNTIISNSLSFDIVNKSLQFKYKTQKATILEASLKKLIPAWEFTIIPYNGQKHQSDITDIVSSLQLQFESSEEADKGNSHSKKMLKALLSEGESIWEITEKILNSFEYTSRFTKTKTLYQFLFLATFINCGRFSDIKNVDPKSFKLVQNKYLGVIIQCLVTETKTSVSRHIYFFSARGRIDPLVYLDEFLRNSEPVLKRVNRTGNSSSNKQEYQLLKDNLVRSYNKALKKNAPYPIFAIKNGPKSHIGRHLMTSFLSMKGLTELTNVVGNWSDKRASAVARTTYTHQITAIPDHYFALVSRYYAYDPISKEMIALKDETNPIEEWQHIEQLKGSAEGSIRYPAWNGIISQEVLDYLSSYINRRISRRAEGRGSLLTCGDVEENPGPSNLLTVHQNLPALPVDATSDEVRKNLMDMFRDRQAFSEHTWKMLLSVCRSWAAWCKLNNRKWFPAEPEDVRDYLLYLQARGLAVKTIQQHLGQLNMLHRRSGLPRPSDSNAVSLVMRRIRKENVDAGERAKQALAFERTDFDQVRSLMENSDRCQDIRNLAFLGIAYNTLLRIAEIARIRVKDISRTDGGRMLIHIGRTKTLVSTAGVEKALSLGVTKLVERWISVSGVADDPNNYLFCRVRKNGVAAPSATSQLSTRALEGIFEATHRLIYGAKDDSGQRYLAWSGHSARVGAARDMARAGVSIPEIMQAGGWTNVNIVMNYIRNLDSETGAMVRLLEDGD